MRGKRALSSSFSLKKIHNTPIIFTSKNSEPQIPVKTCVKTLIKEKFLQKIACKEKRLV